MKLTILKQGEVVHSKELEEGSLRIGRSPGCEIVLPSSSISKQHALLIVKDQKVALVDLGSVNGIFVNGILVKKKRLEWEDEIKIAEYELRILPSLLKKNRPPGQESGLNSETSVEGNLAFQTEPESFAQPEAESTPLPSSQKEKILSFIDKKILFPFYELLRTTDWRWILAYILVSSLLLSVLTTVYPVIRWGKTVTAKESLARGHTLVAQLVRENYRILSKTNDSSRLTVESAESEKGVLNAFVLEPKSNTILAPTRSFNKTITDVYALLALKKITEGKEERVSVLTPEEDWILAQPIRIYSPELNENTLAGIILLYFQLGDEVSATFQPMVEAGLFAVFFSFLAFFFIYKMVSHPLTKMKDQLDSALKGENTSVAAEVKLGEMESLATVINFAISRFKQGEKNQDQSIDSKDLESEDTEYIKSIKEWEEATTDGILLLDRDKKVCFVGKILEEMLNMRSQYAQGQNISDACRDTGFAGTVIDMADRVINSLGNSQKNMLDLNGIARNMIAVAHKNKGGEIRFILLIVQLGENQS